MAYSDGPVTLADIMKVKGEKVELSTHQTPPKKQPDLRRLTLYLSQWDPGLGVGGDIGHPTIHHFCTQPQGPQLPIHMQVLSRNKHTATRGLAVKPSLTDTTERSTELNRTQSASKETDSQRGTSKSVSFVPSLPSKQSRSSTVTSRNVTSTGVKSLSSLSEEGSTDIVDLAKARLQKETGRKGISSKDTTLSKAKKPTAKGSQRSKDSAGRSSATPGESKKELSPVKEGSGEERMVMAGTRMEVSQNPGR